MKFIKKTIVILLLCLLLCGCSFSTDEKARLNDLDFTVLSEEVLPEELKALIEEKKISPFEMTYSDENFLYICVGYGQQKTGGYSIAVNELYVTDTSICVDTCLLGPSPEEAAGDTPSCPYIVIQTEYLDKTVEFQ